MTRGRISRAEYLDRSLSRLQPWISQGISRRTWERRRLRDRDASPPQAASLEQGAVASVDDDALAEARAAVEAIYRQMEAERARRANWWAQPIPEWPEKLVMRNISRDETITIDLNGNVAREKRKHVAAPSTPMWWEDS